MTRRWLAGIGTVLVASLFSAAQARRADDGEDDCYTPDGLAELAADMESRQAALDRREAAILAKEADLRAVEERLNERMAQLKTIREEIASQLERIEDVEDQRVDENVRRLQSMRPKQGALVVAKMDNDLAVSVLQGMSPGKAGKLLAAMPPGLAADLMQKLSTPIEVPTP